MNTTVKACGTAIAVAAVSMGLVACGSDAKPEATSESSSSSSASRDMSTAESATAASSSAPKPAGAHETIADYIKQAGITETPAKRGEPGTPTIDLPVPAGWREAGPDTPEFAYGAIVLNDPTAAADPATIIALVSKLTGPVEAAKIFEFAPGELNNLPGYDGAAEGQKNTLSGFDAVQLGGSYVKDGVQRMIAQKTVVIPAANGDGLYVLQLNANGLEDQMGPLLDAVSDIDANTKITP